MAQRVVVQLDCDMDRKSGKDVETVSFGYQGDTYELELCSKHQKLLHDLISSLVPSARKISASRPRNGGRTASKRSNREENAAIRAWAQRNGIKVSERGRIAADVIEQFHTRGSENGSKNGRTVVVPAFKDGSATSVL
jgi:hypothetical protein